jgi:multidrug/hemolysin transport system ATP-binding protein
MEGGRRADYVIVIDDGQIVAKGTPSYLKEIYTTDKLSLVCTDPQKTAALLEAEAFPYTQKADRFSSPSPPPCRPCRFCKGLGFISGFEVINGTMDDAFIAITGKEIRE